MGELARFPTRARAIHNRPKNTFAVLYAQRDKIQSFLRIIVIAQADTAAVVKVGVVMVVRIHYDFIKKVYCCFAFGRFHTPRLQRKGRRLLLPYPGRAAGVACNAPARMIMRINDIRFILKFI
jgi:hypothetical protein